MANLINTNGFYARRLSEYVPAMQYSADMQLNSNTRISFGAPAAYSAGYFLAGQSIASAGVLQGSALLNGGMSEAPFGRALTLNLSGPGTGTLIVDGWDYLNQPMSESIPYNGATVSSGKKAFKSIRQVTWTAVAGTTMNIGNSGVYGLPYKAIKAYTEEANGSPTTVGSLNAADLTFPATLTTGDPRGTYSAATASNGSIMITVTLDFANDVDANNNGGLMGVPHYTN